MDEQQKLKIKKWFTNMYHSVKPYIRDGISVLYDEDIQTDEEYEQQLKDLEELKVTIDTLLD